MSLVIGKRALFFRTVPKKNGDGFEQRPTAGFVLDKVKAVEKINKHALVIDFYLVKCDGGGIELFTPEELTELIVEQNSIA